MRVRLVGIMNAIRREREKVIWPYDRMLGIILVLRCVFTTATQGTSALHCSVATGLKYARCG